VKCRLEPSRRGTTELAGTVGVILLIFVVDEIAFFEV